MCLFLLHTTPITLNTIILLNISWSRLNKASYAQLSVQKYINAI